ncbi:hypothetical protein [Sphingomonas sp. PP-CE-1G-424]|jgi:hypothetical protein|uniref:hypothetical protein n=1 Tax=Sphingomonas sp. PP-CE-1G-424 TaxID=2135658 RepID=UPI0010D030F1|nr:hypothetical protein [Sphingomonas sp. PP-CE-1G-424]TCP73121.1 hypothetical protein C8J43_101868 [Sphingomonas sp. PP-CE-1G-424]
MLRHFGEEIWIADGPTVSVAGFAYRTRMMVIRLSDGNDGRDAIAHAFEWLLRK